MKTVPFSDILAQTCQLIGLDKATLNDKSFCAIRDMTNRRIGAIWDREEWPDTERRLNTWPGVPVTSLTVGAINYEDDTVAVKVNLDVDFPRIYLADFEGDAYKLGTIGSTNVKFLNPFYYLTSDGKRTSISEKEYNFTYETAVGQRGEYIKNFTINIPNSTPEYSAYAGPNGPLTTKVVFEKNSQLLIQLEAGSLQGLQVFSNDSRANTRAVEQSFLVEDFDDRNDLAAGGSVYNQEYTYLRFRDSNKKFITYRNSAPVLNGISYSTLNDYSKDAQVYFDTLQGSGAYNPPSVSAGVCGNFWKALSAVPRAVSPANISQYWQMVEIPYRFKDYLINGVSADFMRSEGRPEEANVFDQLAEVAVEQQIDVLLRQQGQVQRMNMVYCY